MDENLMSRALKSVLGEGYESQSRHVGGGSSRTPTPHDVLQGRVSKSNPSGGDMHVPTSLGADAPKKPKGKLKSVEYVAKAQGRTREEAVTHGLLTAGATGGVLSLRPLYSHTKAKLAEAKGVKGPTGTLPEAVKATGKLRALKNPKVAAGVAAGAAGLELAGLAGDFMGRKVTSKKQPVLKALDPTPTSEVITFSKVDDEKRQVFGWFSISKKDGVDVIDLQGDTIPIEETEPAAYRYMLESRKGGNQHARVTRAFGMDDIAKGDEPVHVGDVIESMVFTPEKIKTLGLPADFPQGWWGGLQIHDEETWGQIKRGERKGFSVHGKGRREPLEVSKAATRVVVPDRKEQAKDVALGVAGATAAGSGAGGALLPLANKRGLIGTVKAERVGGRLKTIGAVVGGTAGVYGGLHAANQAAKNPKFRAIPATAKAKVKGTVGVKKAWDPVVDHRTPEQRRARRAKGYEAGAGVGAGAAAGGAVHQLSRGRKALGRQVGSTTVKMRQGQAQARIADNVAHGVQAEVNRHQGRIKVAKPAQRGGMVAGHNRKVAGLKAKGAVERDEALFNIKVGAKAHNLRAVQSAGKHSRAAGKLGLVGAGLAGAAGVVHHKRKGSWRPYEGVR